MEKGDLDAFASEGYGRTKDLTFSPLMPIPANHIIPPAFILTPVEWRPEIMKRRGIAPQITADQCIRCGQCVAACPSFVIDLGEKQAEVVKSGMVPGLRPLRSSVSHGKRSSRRPPSYENYPGRGLPRDFSRDPGTPPPGKTIRAEI